MLEVINKHQNRPGDNVAVLGILLTISLRQCVKDPTLDRSYVEDFLHEIETNVLTTRATH